MRVQVSQADRDREALAHNDPDLAAVRDVLDFYNTRAYYSRACAEDLAILIKRARRSDGTRQRNGQLSDPEGERELLR